MINTLNSQIMGILTRVQNYPGLLGLKEVESKVQALCTSYQVEYPQTIALFFKAYTYDRNDDLPKAIECYLECLDLLTEDDVQLDVFINGMLASIYVDFEQFQLGYRCYERALANLHRVDDNIAALVYCNISDLYLTLGHYHDAIIYAKQGMVAARNSQRLLDNAICSLNLGYSYAHIGELDQALDALECARDLGVELNSARTLALFYSYRAQIRVQMSLKNSADRVSFPPITEDFAQAESYFVQVVDEHNRVENLVYWANYLEQVGDHQQAKVHCYTVKNDYDITKTPKLYVIYADTLTKIYTREQAWQALVALQSERIEIAEASVKTNDIKLISDIVTKVDEVAQSSKMDLLAETQKHMGAITDIGQFIATATDLDALLPEALTKINTILPTFEFGIALYDHQTDILDYRYFVDAMGLVESMQVTCAQSNTVGAYVIKNQTTVHLNSITDDTLAPYVNEDASQQENKMVIDNGPVINSILIAPIILNKVVIGLLSVQHDQDNQYQKYHRYLIEHLASFIAVSLENQKQRQRLETANKTLQHINKIEPLTGLYNRYQLDSVTPRLVEQAKLHGKTLSVLMIDIDEYKAYNDYHGHLKGDEALRHVSRLLKQTFDTEEEYLFRYGGDEFMVICYGLTAQEVERKILQLCQALYKANITSPRATVSDRLSLSIGGVNTQCGTASCTTENIDWDFEWLSEQADRELYQAKAAGRNGFKLTECDYCVTTVTG